MRTPAEKQFLALLGTLHQGRCGFRPVAYEKARREFGGLLDDGLIRERRLGSNPGFQLTEAGRAYLNPTGDQ
jgi:hypothetical protein